MLGDVSTTVGDITPSILYPSFLISSTAFEGAIMFLEYMVKVVGLSYAMWTASLQPLRPHN